MIKYENNDDVVAGAYKENECLSCTVLRFFSEKKADLTQFKFHLIVPVNLKRNVGCKMSFF